MTQRIKSGVNLSQRRETRAGYLFLLPWLIGFFCLTVIPMIASLYFSFTSYDMMTDPVWVGLSNFSKIFTSDVKFQYSLRVTTTYVLLGVPLQLAFALLLAVIFKKDRPGIRFYRAAYYLPSLFGGSIAVAILWRQLFNKTGVINQMLAVIGIQGKNWINSPDTAIYTLISLLIWQFGASMVIFLSSLKQIPQDYYEAATIDGASRPRQFFSITLPLLTPMVFFNIVMQFINAFQAFTPAYIVSAGTGGPMNSTLFYTLNIYLQGFSYFKMGYACALAWILVALIGAFTGLIFGTSKKWVYYD
ncbi:MAG: sugar ABC transporter permease [Eubacteriales bacterium]|nr:sugar ABC transporter permease [Eubacteriales bacterium]